MVITALLLLAVLTVHSHSVASPYDTLRAQCADGHATGVVHLGDGQFTLAYVQLRLFEGDVQLEEALVPVDDGQTELAFAFAAELEMGSSYRVTSLGNTLAQINFDCTAAATPAGTPVGTPVATPIGAV